MRTATRRVAARAALPALMAACLVTVMPDTAPAAAVGVTIRDNLFAPQEVHVDPGDTVTWTNAGLRTHDVTSDTGAFTSGDMFRGSRFSHTFTKEGTYYYHCSFHGRAGKQGMWGVVVVGDPDHEPTPPPGEKRPRIDVPGDFETIQAAVDSAASGSTIVVGPGKYQGGVKITTDDLILRGVDRYRTVLHGGDERDTGVLVEGAADVTVANLTVRNFVTDGVSFVDSIGYTAAAIDAIDNRMHGVSAVRSYDGVVRSSFGWGSGEAAFHVAECMGCGTLLHAVQARSNHAGIAGINATGLTIRSSRAIDNGAGIVMASVPGGAGPGRGALLAGNLVRGDLTPDPSPPRSAETFGIPRSTGIWLAGVSNTVVRSNVLSDFGRYGVVLSASPDGVAPARNEVVDNEQSAAGLADLAWDGEGSDNCFSGNDFTGTTGPPDIQSRYACEARPFAGEPYGPVRDELAEALPASLAEPTAQPREPVRPACQKGKPGCHRHRGVS